VYAATGSAVSIAAGRVSYVLGLQGPCESIDTACSSAVTALRSASLCLCASDCAAALTAAVNVVLTPHVSVSYARAGMLSPDGRCKTFDASANGYVRSEGIGGLVVSHPGRITARASLRSTAVRQDGMSASLTAPNGSAQVALLSLAAARAATNLALLWCVESHGTGTLLGDPTEVRALAAPLPAQGVRALGGIKANLGHLEPAAGMVGLTKLIDLMNTTRAVSNAHLRVLNQHLAPSAGANLVFSTVVQVPRQTETGTDTSAGVSSFGYSGTITHAVLSAMAPTASVQPSPILLLRRRAFSWESLTSLLTASAALLAGCSRDLHWDLHTTY
jgi:acyl transferase domain-containing protein